MSNKKSDQSTTVKNTFSNLIKIYSESSKLLRDAEELLKRKKFHCDHGNYLGTAQSKHIDSPEHWFVPYGTRIFKSTEYNDLLLGITIIYIGKDNTPIEPLIVFGIYKMKEGKESSYRYNDLRHLWYHSIEDQRLDIIHEYNSEPDSDSIFNNARIIGKALTDIENIESIERKIITPLFELIKN